METDKALRSHLRWLIEEGNAHLTFEQAVGGVPPAMRDAQSAATPHSLWALLEHLRICQWDILEFCRDENHVSPEFPDGYWPTGLAGDDDGAWDDSVAAFLTNRAELVALVEDPSTDLLAPIPHGSGQTVLREALLAADHNAYHLGQIVCVRRALGCWPEST